MRAFFWPLIRRSAALSLGVPGQLEYPARCLQRRSFAVDEAAN